MQVLLKLATVAILSVPAASLSGQAIIAQLNGLANPDHLIDFGANVLPQFTPVSTQFPGITVTHASYFTTGVVNNLVGGFLTNDPIGQPDTLSIRFNAPIRDVSFVYHQIAMSRTTVFRAMLRGQTVDSFSNLSDQYQPNNYFGFTNRVFDEVQIDFVVDFNVDTLAFNDVHASCTTRNGTGLNLAGFQCVTPPVVGGIWQSTVATTPNTVGAFLAVGLGGPDPGLPFLGGELLIQVSPPPVLIPGSGAFSLQIPGLPASIGFELSTQGMRVDNVGPTTRLVLMNALDLQFGI